MARKKKTVTNLLISGIADKGKAVGRTQEGEVIFVDGAVPGDVVDVLVLRKKKSLSEAVVINVVSLSPDRIDPICEHFTECGGCKWQDLSYSAQLEHKEKTVKDSIKRIGKLDASIVLPIIGCDDNLNYRNKLEYSASTKRWIPKNEVATSGEIENTGAFGFHKAGYFDKIVAIDKCHLQDDLSNTIRNFVGSYIKDHGFSFYDVRNHEGFLRNMIVRNTLDGQWMVIIAFGEEEMETIQPLLKSMRINFPQIVSLNYVINKKLNDTIWDLNVITYYGQPFIIEKLGNIKYKIGTKSFFQTNPRQARRLFDVTVEMADFKPSDNVYDLYTGLGSIALYIADKVERVTGIEEVPEAIEDARENMLLNDIKNATFYAGDVKDILNEDFIKKHGKADVVITDPPRAGMHESVVNTLLELAAPRLVYISCNPATQARDLALLSFKYDLVKVQPVDMFPHTHHIESVALLQLRK